MADKRQIKIVKREARIKPPGDDSIEKQTGGRPAEKEKLDPVKVVSGWIGEWRRNKAQARIRLDQVFGNAG